MTGVVVCIGVRSAEDRDAVMDSLRSLNCLIDSQMNAVTLWVKLDPAVTTLDLMDFEGINHIVVASNQDDSHYTWLDP